MESFIRVSLLLVYTLINAVLYFPIHVVDADPVEYCEFGFCEVDEYCCGKDKCCKETSELWYFWIGIILVVATIIIVTSVKYFLKGIERSRDNRHYEPVLNQIVEET